MADATVQATLFTDSACPWGYSANPDLTVLRWRFGAQLDWKIVMIGLAENADRYVQIGFTPERQVQGNKNFRARFGMPFAFEPRERMTATGLVCRAVVAVRLLQPELEWAAVRALQLEWFTNNTLMDEDAPVAAGLSLVEGLDVPAVMATLHSPEVEAAYQADRALARSAEGGATHWQGKSANSDGAERYTAPSVIFEAADGRTIEAGGFQSLAAYDVCLANLDRSLDRRGPAEDPLQLLAEFDHGLTTQEVAAAMAPSLTEPDREAAETALTALVDLGAVSRTPLGDDALWRVA
jgi:protein-disulfide isomerase-like protein with CxxC motif